MHELHAILDSWRGLQGSNRDAVLATVVHVRDSAYRRPGARMLIVPDGRRIGSISGGCLEGEIAKKAWWFTESRDPVVRVYDTTSDDDAIWEFGLGCNGIVHVMLERVDTAGTAEMLGFLEAHRASNSPAVIATVIRTGDSGIRVGDRLLLDQEWVPQGTLADSEIGPRVLTRASAVLRERKSCLAHLGDTDVFFEWVGPLLSVVIFGAGHDVIPLVSIAKQQGWNLTVADGRPMYAKADRFPEADRVVLMGVENPLREIHIDAETAVVMITHNYPLDARLLPCVLAAHPRYLGLLGPKTRTERLFAELGLRIAPNVHAPVGLDIGGDTPGAVALSIVAEIQAVASQREGGMLKLRNGAIHSPALEFGGSSTHKPSEAMRPAYCETMVNSNA